jgi:hypothetical protein
VCLGESSPDPDEAGSRSPNDQLWRLIPGG